MNNGFKEAVFTGIGLISAFLIGCSSSEKKTDFSESAYKDYYVITSQMHSYKQEFKEVDSILTKARERFADDLQINLYHAHIKASLGQINEASRLFSQVVTKYPENELGLSAAAEFYFETERKDIAQALYEALRGIDPNNANYWIQEGLIFLEFGEIAQAAGNFIYVVENIKDEAFRGHFHLGRLYKMTGQIEKAESAYKNCQIFSESCLLEFAQMRWALNKKNLVFNSLEKFLIKKPRSVRVLAALTDFYYAQGMYDEAASTLERIERVDPTNSSVTRRLAQLMVRKENYVGALERYQMLIDSNRADEKDRINLANLHILLKDYNSALRELAQVKSDSRFYEDLISTKYKLALLNGGEEEAHKFILKEHKSKKYDQSGYVLAKSYIKRENFNKASRILDKVLKKSPEFIQGLHLKGLVSYELNQKKEAVVYFEKVISLNPEMDQALNFIAYHLAENNENLDRAEELAKRAFNLKPLDPHYLDTLGFVLFQKKDFESAMSFLEKAHGLLPGEPVIAEHLADVYVELGLKQKAMDIYRLALQSLKGDNLARVGGKIAQIKSVRELSSVSGK